MKKIFVFLLFLISVNIFANQNQIKVPDEYSIYVRRLCYENDLPHEIVFRLIEWESRWNPLCVTQNKNKTYDIGLMKLNSKYIEDFQWRYNKGKPFDPKDWKKNAEIGIKHLARLRELTGSMFGAVASYNMGLTAYRKWRNHERQMPEPTMKELEYVFQY